MKLRDYQTKAIEAVEKDFESCTSALIVIPTGGGKTVVFSHIAKRFTDRGRVMILAHREELIRQAAHKVGLITGIGPDIEMASEYADIRTMHGKQPVVVSSIQTQVSGRGGKGRMTRFDPFEFSLLICDEAHHAIANSWRKVIEHYRQNPNLKVLGVTATPDRADEGALGQVFEKSSFVYDIADGIGDGWLVPIQQRSVFVQGLDFSTARTTAGDLNGADLAAIMEFEENLHAIATPTMELAAGRKTLVFAASVAHAERLCEIFNRHKADCARFVCGATHDDIRKRAVADFKTGKYQILVNVGVFTEGFDEPSIEVIVSARPTKSRSLFCQMIGRGTRPLEGVVDAHPDSSEMRRGAIASSAKPMVEVIDFVGNSGKHKLVSCADILGGKYDDEVVDRAKKMAAKEKGPVDMSKMLDAAKALLFAEEAATRAKRDAATRAGLLATAKYSSEIVNAFDILDLGPSTAMDGDKSRRPTPAMMEALRRGGIKDPTKLSFAQAQAIMGKVQERRRVGQCTLPQAKVLKRYGYDTNMSFTEARKTIDAIAANGWQKPSPVTEVVL